MTGAAAATAASVVVPVHNGHDALVRCLAALERHTDARFPVWLVDDASMDVRIRPLLDAFAARRPGTRRIDLERNAGFVGAVNAALSGIEGDVVLLNSDARVTAGWLEGLLRCRAREPRVGLACPLSNNATLLSIAGVDGLLDDPDEIAAALREAGPPSYPRLPTAVGFCLYVSAELRAASGPLDPVYGRGYGEENDLSMRALRLGFEIACCDDVYVHHEGEASFGESPTAARARAINRQRLDRRWPGYAPSVIEWARANPLRERLEQVHAACERRRFPGRPRVLHVMHAFDSPGGVEAHTAALVDALQDRCTFNVVAPGKARGQWTDFVQQRRKPGLRVSWMSPELITAGPRVLEFPAALRDGNVEAALGRFLAGDYDVVHVHGALGWNTLRACRLARDSGARVVVSVHDMGWTCAEYNMVTGPRELPCGRVAARGADPGCVACLAPRGAGFPAAAGDDLPAFIEGRYAAAREAFALADAVVAPSRFAADRVVAAFGDEVAAKIRLLPHGVRDFAPLHRLHGTATLTVGYVGRFSPRKGAVAFIEVARRLAGEGFLFEAWGHVDERVRPAARAAMVRMHDTYRPAELPERLLGVDLVLMPAAVEETYCLALSEMHALGIPVAAARIGAIAERIRDGDNGWLFEPGDIDAMVRLLLRLRDDRAALDRVAGALARERPVTIAQNAAAYGALYEELAAKAPHSRARAPSPSLAVLPPEPRARTPLGGSAYDAWVAASERAAVDAGVSMPIVVLDGRGALEVNRAIASAGREWVVLLEDGDALAEGAAESIRAAVARDPGAALIYGDHDTCSAKGERYDPVFKPQFSRELLCHTPYLAGAVAVRADRLLAAGGLRSGDVFGVHEWAFRLSSSGDARPIVRADGLLAHRWDVNVARLESEESRRRYFEIAADSVQREGVTAARLEPAADAPGMWAYGTSAGKPLTLFLHCRGDAAAAGEAIESLLAAAGPRIAEILVDLPDAEAEALGLRVAQRSNAPLLALGSDLPAALVDLVASAQHPWIAIVDASCRAFVPGTFERLEQGIRGPGVAAIAADVSGPRGELRSAARVAGAGRAGVAADAPAPSIVDPLAAIYRAPREVTALSAWFSLWRREALRVPGLLDAIAEAGAHALDHVGFGLRQRGWSLVSRPIVAARMVAEAPEGDPAHAAAMRARWKPAPAEDPGFSPALSPSLRPLQAMPRFPPRGERVRICAFPFDRWGVGEMRVRQPCAALQQAGWADVVTMPDHESGTVPAADEWRRLGADTLLAHNFFHDYQLAGLEAYAREDKALRVLGMDDLLTQLPSDNPYAATLYPDIARRIDAAKALMHRLVVTTPELADAYGGGIEAHVVPNTIDPRRWEGLPRPARRGGKPRVGWAGARQHRADLMLLETAMRATHREVDWVLLGMCPAALAPWAAEVHSMVPVARYPSALAALGLDVAVAPLVDHPFNRAKSNLKLLEYGMLGLPVVASDVGPYRGMPVLHARSADQWSEAVIVLARDAARARSLGDALRQWVLTNATLPAILPKWRRVLGGT